MAFRLSAKALFFHGAVRTISTTLRFPVHGNTFLKAFLKKLVISICGIKHDFVEVPLSLPPSQLSGPAGQLWNGKAMILAEIAAVAQMGQLRL